MRTRSADVKSTTDKADLAPIDDVHTPNLISPPGTRTPPTITNEKRTGATRNLDDPALGRIASEPIDPLALSKALHFEQAGKQRDRTPGDSPKRKRQRVYGDRCARSH